MNRTGHLHLVIQHQTRLLKFETLLTGLLHFFIILTSTLSRQPDLHVLYDNCSIIKKMTIPYW